jgi:hypothetical protein
MSENSNLAIRVQKALREGGLPRNALKAFR